MPEKAFSVCIKDSVFIELERYTGDSIDGADLVNFKSSFIAGESNTLKDYTYSSIISISSHLHRGEDFLPKAKRLLHLDTHFLIKNKAEQTQYIVPI